MPESSYQLAPGLAVRLVGRSLVTLAVLVALVTVVGVVLGGGWVPAGVVAGGGSVVAAGWALWLLRGAAALRLSDEGYVVRLLGGVGVTRASWTDVVEAVATSPQDTPCLMIRLRDGRHTRLPMAALAAERDVVALDVRRRLRDAHSALDGGAPDSAAGEESL